MGWALQTHLDSLARIPIRICNLSDSTSHYLIHCLVFIVIFKTIRNKGHDATENSSSHSVFHVVWWNIWVYTHHMSAHSVLVLFFAMYNFILQSGILKRFVVPFSCFSDSFNYLHPLEMVWGSENVACVRSWSACYGIGMLVCDDYIYVTDSLYYWFSGPIAILMVYRSMVIQTFSCICHAYSTCQSAKIWETIVFHIHF